MIFPSRVVSPPYTKTGKASKSPLTPFTARTAVIITFLVGAMLLIDQQLKTEITASPVEHIDKSSRRVVTEKAAFLADFNHVDGTILSEGELLVLELSPITQTVVAYKQFEALLVNQPRENIFSYWPITTAMTLLSFFLLIRWNHLNGHFELLLVNLILLVIITILYLISH